MNLLQAFAIQPTSEVRSKHSLLTEFKQLDTQITTLFNKDWETVKQYREIELNALFLTARAKVILRKLELI